MLICYTHVTIGRMKHHVRVDKKTMEEKIVKLKGGK
jgi:hypothetical protein